MGLALTVRTDDVAHSEQLDVWADEMCWALMDWLKEPESYDDKIALAEAIKRELRNVVDITLERAQHAIAE